MSKKPRGNPGYWGGDWSKKAREVVGAWLPAPCLRCGRVVSADDDWQVDHIQSRKVAPELSRDPSNWAPSHARCNAAAGARLRNGLARRGPVVSGPVPRVESAAATDWSRLHAGAAGSVGMGVLDLDSGAVPRLMSPPHPRAVGSYGDVFLERADALAGRLGQPRLRPWQRLCVMRGLEHDAEGDLVWRRVLVLAPRGSGKSVLMQQLCAARMESPDLFGGGPQKVMHTSMTLENASYLHSQYLEAYAEWVSSGGIPGWGFKRRAESPTIMQPDGGEWVAKSMLGAPGRHGYGLVVVDELWNVVESDARAKLNPVQVAVQTHVQTWMFSTRSARETPYIAKVRRSAAAEGSSVCLVEWSGDPAAELDDVQSYADASPWWDRGRHREIVDAIGAGDEPSVLRCEWRNEPPEGPDGSVREWPVGWSGCVRAEPGAAQVVVVEHGDEGVYGVVGGRVDGQVVSCWGLRVGSLAEAVAEVERMSAGGAQVVAGLSVAGAFPGCAKVGVRETKEHSARFAEAVRDGQLAHDHGADVMQESRDAVAVRVDGRQVLSANRSRGPVPVLKGMLWAHMWLSRPQEVALIV